MVAVEEDVFMAVMFFEPIITNQIKVSMRS
jgi:hypothetical protein